MIVEAVLVIDAALQDATIGVAAHLASVPLETGDSAPDTPTFYNEMEDAQASREQMPDGNGPYLLTSSAGVIDRNPATRPIADGSIDILIRYGVRDKDTDAATRAMSYTLRAIRKTLAQIRTTNAGNALISRNSVQVIEVANISTMLFEAPQSDTLVSGGVRCTLRCRDLWVAA